MEPKYILWPVLAQIVLTFIVCAVLGRRRFKAFKAGGINVKQAKIDARAWPDNVIKTSNNLTNQFETPVLFYVLCIALFVLNKVDGLALALAWGYAISRYVHAYVHNGSNYIPKRFLAFAFGGVMLLGMTLLVAWHIAQ